MSKSVTVKNHNYLNLNLAIIVIGASGDLAMKKTYPSLCNLFFNQLLPPNTVIWGYGRTDLTNSLLRRRLRPHLPSKNNLSPNNFLSVCHYQRGQSYNDIGAFQKIRRSLPFSNDEFNILFYLAIPSNLFHQTCSTINCVFFKSFPIKSPSSYWKRVVLEKPFGRDLSTYQNLSENLSRVLQENQMFRIDHYLGKQMARSIPYLRFNHPWTKSIWNRKNVQRVLIVMKEDFGTEGRGGYFDNYGIVRDVIQNHLLQLLTLVAMQPKYQSRRNASNLKREEERVRDAKVEVLNAIRPPSYPDDCVLGQYDGYVNDPTIKNKNTLTPTFAVVRFHIENDLWKGVPFYLVAGKALNERKVEVRLVLLDGNNHSGVTKSSVLDRERNELVVRIQPESSISLTTNIKKFDDKFTNMTMAFNGKHKVDDDAYAKLILDAMECRSSSFVRDDELRKSWEIFTPLLNQIENVMPYRYKMGSTGPHEAANLVPEVVCKEMSHYSSAIIPSRL